MGFSRLDIACTAFRVWEKHLHMYIFLVIYMNIIILENGSNVGNKC